MMKLPLTAIILTKNEEEAILDCIKSLDFCSQIIVVDSESTDSTVLKSRQVGATVVNFKWNKQYPKKKQWSLERTEIENDWVLFLDADERVSHDLAKEIANNFKKSINKFAAYDVKVKYFFDGKFLRFGHKVRKRILINKNKCHFPIVDDLHVKNMWEVEGHYQPLVNGRIGMFKNYVSHYDPDPLYDYFSRHNRYSDWEASMRISQSSRNSVRESKTLQGKLFEMLPGKPIVFFIYSYFLRLGFLDGRAGFNYSLALSFYYWQINLKYRELKNEA